MASRDLGLDDPLEDFSAREIALLGVAKRVYVAGQGPAVIVMRRTYLHPDLRRVEMKIRVMIGRAGMARIARRASRVPHIFDEVDLRAAPMRLRDALQRMKVEMMRLCVLPAPHRYEPETGRLAYPAKQLRQRVEAPSDSGSCVPRIWLMMPDNVRSGWGTTAFARSFMADLPLENV